MPCLEGDQIQMTIEQTTEERRMGRLFRVMSVTQLEQYRTALLLDWADYPSSARLSDFVQPRVTMITQELDRRRAAETAQPGTV